jgi:hypothetical protein
MLEKKFENPYYSDLYWCTLLACIYFTSFGFGLFLIICNTLLLSYIYKREGASS